MPLRLAQQKFGNLIQPMTDNVKLVLPDGTFMTGLTHMATIPINAIKTLEGEDIKAPKRNVKFLMGATVPFLSLSRRAIDDLNLRDSMKRLTKAGADIEPGLVINYPIYINNPCYLSDIK